MIKMHIDFHEIGNIVFKNTKQKQSGLCAAVCCAVLCLIHARIVFVQWNICNTIYSLNNLKSDIFAPFVPYEIKWNSFRFCVSQTTTS